MCPLSSSKVIVPSSPRHTTEIDAARPTGAAHGASNTAPNLVNRTFLRFFAGQEWPTEQGKRPVKNDWAAALHRLPRLTPGIHVDGRSPERPMSFSTKSAQEISEFESQLKEIAAGNAPRPRIAFGYGGWSEVPPR